MNGFSSGGLSMPQETHVVTGAFGFSGRFITKRLLGAGFKIRTLTNSVHRQHPFGDQVNVHPFHFDDQAALVESLEGASVLYNTYWVRFTHGSFSHDLAVENTLKLFRAAREAGVKRIIHTSITNPSLDSPLDYFRGKAQLERALSDLGVSYAILRPAVLFGTEGILINNIAWILRRFPIFGIFGDGSYKLQPIYVDDFAALAVEHGAGADNLILDAIGPETFTYKDLVRTIGRIISKPRPIVSVPDWFGYAVGWTIGKLVGDVIITRGEIEGLKAGLLDTDSSPAGGTRLTEWAKQNADVLGRNYASELARREDRRSSYLEIQAE
jgi:NADH dehydrogenase